MFKRHFGATSHGVMSFFWEVVGGAPLQGFPTNLVSPCHVRPSSLIGWRGISRSNAGDASSWRSIAWRSVVLALFRQSEKALWCLPCDAAWKDTTNVVIWHHFGAFCLWEHRCRRRPLQPATPLPVSFGIRKFEMPLLASLKR